MKFLSVILNLTAATGYLKNPLQQSETPIIRLIGVLNTMETYLYIAGVIFVVAMSAFSLLKFEFFVGPEKKTPARNQLIFFIGLFAILLIQVVIEKIITVFMDPVVSRVMSTGIAIILLLVFYRTFCNRVQMTSVFKLYE